MQSQVLEQLYSFAIFILVGFLIGLLFDMFRISRRTFKTSDILTALEDILFWILTGLLIIFSIFKFNNGDIRVYIILAIFIGITLYMLVFSKIVINSLVKIVTIIKKIVSHIIKILLYPINLIIKVLKFITKPIKIWTQRYHSLSGVPTSGAPTKFGKKLLKMKKKQNKSKLKKDFA